MSAADRLRWRCRRGMLELDLILLRFLDTQYAQLSAGERQTFDALLALEDDVLLALVSGHREAPTAWAAVVDRLRAC